MSKKIFVKKCIQPHLLKELLVIEPVLAKFIDLNEPLYIRTMPDKFVCLVHTVISQQISSLAVNNIWHKLIFNLKKITPKTFSNANTQWLNSIGIPEYKIYLLKRIANDILIKKLNLNKLAKLSNEEIYKQLSEYKHIGIWTIDMLLIFTYYRNDILATSDFGVKQGLKKIYPKSNINKKYLNVLKKKFHKYGTLLTFCLWHINATVK